MWRAFFLAIGITFCILGAECMAVKKVVLAHTGTPPPAEIPYGAAFAPAEPKSAEYSPPEWAPWSLLSTGAVVIIYSFTIPRRVIG